VINKQPAGPSVLTKRTVLGAAWTLPTSLGSRVIGLIGTLILARYLTPSEYGDVAAAAILTTTAGSVTTLGVGIYLVANKDISPIEVFHASCWFLITGVIAIGAVWAFCGPLGTWFGAPDIGRYMPVFVSAMLLERVTFVPERMLVRRLKFAKLSISRGFGELAYTFVSVGLAAVGIGAMAVAWGNLARSSVRFLMIVPAVDWHDWLEPHPLKLEPLLKITKYGGNVALAAVATFGMRRWDNLLVSRYFGPAVMGAYNYAYNLADTPAVAIGEQMSDVIGASFPHVEGQRRTTALVRSCVLVSMIMLPLAIGLAVVAPTVVATFFDQEWASVGGMLVFLSVLAAPRPLANILQSYFYASGRPTTVLVIEWASLFAIVIAISTIGRLGIYWTCAAVGIVFVLRTLASMGAVARSDGTSLKSFLLPMFRPFAACMVMTAVLLALRPGLADLRPATRLMIEVTAGASAYVLSVLVVARAESRDLLTLAQSVFTRK